MPNILVVEDDTLLRKAIEEELKEAGYGVVSAKNGAEALTVLEKQPVDLIYLDIMLPEIDGYEVLQKVKLDSRWQQIPVVMLSNLGQIGEINRAMELGATDYIVKANIDLSRLVELTKTKFLNR